MTTLADMTPEERAEMQGIWCDYQTPCGTELAIYSPIRVSKIETLLDPGFGHFGVEDLSRVTPRFDLPRAWAPDGNPVKGCWEEATVCHYGDDDLDVHDPDGNSLDVSAFTNTNELYTDGQVVGRRFVTKWEVQP